jgi:4-amino-4-deoxy-L-arabinose transferase-like glycosyltransferase
MGLVGPDEPRYAFIGRVMAQSGDWVTPRLWSGPWFEKPAFLYWMTAAGFTAGLGPDLAPRLPLALLSLAFLAFFFWRVRVEWGTRVASFATAMLATSAGWLAYSHVAVTDVPLAAWFTAALLLAIGNEARWMPLAAACLGIATLAKGLVPLVLFLPVFAFRWRRALRPAPLAAFAITALPWYILCTLRNGTEFLNVFFIQQQFSRIGSAALQHVQPWWFYIPAGLLLLFPWFPLLGLIRKQSDPRLRLLAYTAIFGFVFFSVSLNKLPSYVLPLVPAVTILIAAELAQRSRAGWWLVAPLALTGILVALPEVVATSLAHGLRSAHIDWVAILLALAAAAIFGVAVALKAPGDWGFALAAFAIALGFIWFETATFPAIDAAASARPAWLAYHPKCAPGEPRNRAYGLYYYSETKLPDCSILDPTSAFR